MGSAQGTTPAFGTANLTNCEREQIHLAASIQPYGALLLLRELGYGAPAELPDPQDFPGNLALLDRLGGALTRYALADRPTDVMGSRTILRDRLGRIAPD